MSRPSDLQNVYWIGGGSGAGKSSVACRLADDYGFRVYSTDEAMADHARRTNPQESPMLATFTAMDMDERWLNRSPTVMLGTFHWFRGEGFRLIVEDLLSLPEEERVVAEGFRLLPELVKPFLADPTRAVWLLPTPELRYAALEARGSLWSIAGRTSNPRKALDNLLERDRLFTDHLATETSRLGLRAIPVGIKTSESEVTRQVADALRLATPG
jgi:2-phosphoglycerate kinase